MRISSREQAIRLLSDRLRAIFGTDIDSDASQSYALIDEAMKEGWDDPKMAEYDDYEARRR